MRGDIVLFLGLVTLIGGGIVIAVIFVLSGGNGGNNACDNALAPLGKSDISQAGFQAQEVGLTKVIEAASAGDIDAANQAFSLADEGKVHNFTHNVDPPFRAVNEEKAKELCEVVIALEEELIVGRRPDVIAQQATRIRSLIRDAAEALGYVRPGG